MKNILASILAIGALALAYPASAAPTTFPQVIGNALLCLDHIDPAFLKKYMTDFFQPPYKTEGEAYWFKVNNVLFGEKITDVFVSVESSQFAFLGVVIEDSQNTAKTKIEANTGTRFIPEQPNTTLRSPIGSFLIQYGATSSKLYCVKQRIYNFT